MPTTRSLHYDGVDYKKFSQIELAVVLLQQVRLEILVVGPLNLPKLTGKH